MLEFIFNFFKKSSDSSKESKKVAFSAIDSQPRPTFMWRAEWLPWGFNEKILYENIPFSYKMLIPDDYPQKIENMVNKNAMLRRIVNDLATFLSSEPLETKNRNRVAEYYINNIIDARLRYNLALDAVMFYGISAYLDLEIDISKKNIYRKVEYIPFKQTRRNNTIVKNEHGDVVLRQTDFEPPKWIYRAYDFRLFNNDGKIVSSFAISDGNYYDFYKSYWGNDFPTFFASVADADFAETVRPRKLKICEFGIPKIEDLIKMEDNDESIKNVGAYWDFFGQDSYYPVSPVESVFAWAQVSNDIAEYFTYLIKNQISSGLMVFLPTTPGATDEERQAEADRFKRNFSGKRRAGEPIIGFYVPGMGDMKDRVPLVQELKRGVDVDNQYIMAEQRATERIINALGFYKSISGMDSAVGFSDKAEEMDKQFEMLEYLTLNIPKQILIKFFNKLLKESYPNEEIVITTRLPFAKIKTSDQDAGDNIKINT